MGKLTLDASLESQFTQLREPTEIAGEAGTSVGVFIPANQVQAYIYRLAESQCPFSEGELAAMQKETGGRSLKEIWAEAGKS